MVQGPIRHEKKIENWTALEKPTSEERKQNLPWSFHTHRKKIFGKEVTTSFILVINVINVDFS